MSLRPPFTAVTCTHSKSICPENLAEQGTFIGKANKCNRINKCQNKGNTLKYEIW
ncbi:hypothetical protein J1TS3_02930 [Siminovitchia fordii]|uniref:Uncharacterized protein n=1 Tax=Siminovitchia fordii TaxID=254759 RepID=A0ABQ4K066_9BACI|nr:hypothetical protein J1TS3_02930 [Siminovitchia fordii]